MKKKGQRVKIWVELKRALGFLQQHVGNTTWYKYYDGIEPGLLFKTLLGWVGAMALATKKQLSISPKLVFCFYKGRKVQQELQSHIETNVYLEWS
jgi:hypothetical protein